MSLAEWRLHLSFFRSGLVWAAWIVAFMLLIVLFLLKPLSIIQGDVSELLVLRMYNYVFPLIAAIVYAQIFANEYEGRVWNWVSVLPISLTQFFIRRWLLATGALFIVYMASFTVIRIFLIPVSVVDFFAGVGGSVLWVGHLALTASLFGKNSMVGLVVPLFYWILETVSQGMITGPFYLFLSSQPAGEYSVLVNRLVLWIAAGILWIVGVMWIRKRRWLLR